VTALIVAPTQVAAMPAYARQTGLPCGQCHENPAGGRKLKPFGEKFRENGNQMPASNQESVAPLRPINGLQCPSFLAEVRAAAR